MHVDWRNVLSDVLQVKVYHADTLQADRRDWYVLFLLVLCTNSPRRLITGTNPCPTVAVQGLRGWIIG
jgi:hypothetical protein